MKVAVRLAWLAAMTVVVWAILPITQCSGSELREKIAGADRVVAYDWVQGSVCFLTGREAEGVIQVASKAQEPPPGPEPHVCSMWFELQFYRRTNLLANVGFQGNGFFDHQGGKLYVVKGTVLKSLQRRLKSDKTAQKAWVDLLAQDLIRTLGVASLQAWSAEVVKLRKGDGLGTYGFQDRESGTNYVAHLGVPSWEQITRAFPYKPAPDVLVHFAPSGKPECVFVTWGIDVGCGVIIGAADYKSVVFGKKAAWKRNQEVRQFFGVPALVAQNCDPAVTQL